MVFEDADIFLGYLDQLRKKIDNVEEVVIDLQSGTVPSHQIPFVIDECGSKLDTMADTSDYVIRECIDKLSRFEESYYESGHGEDVMDLEVM